jgi:MFS family permease
MYDSQINRFAPRSPAQRTHAVHLGAATLLRVSAEGLGTALVLIVHARTGQAATAGFIQTAVMLPYVLSGPVTGHALDGIRRPRTLALALVGCYVTAAALLMLVAGRTPLIFALLIAVVVGCTEPIVVALTSLLPRFVPPDRLTRAYGLEASTYNLAAVVGPGLAAGIAAWSGAGLAATVVVGSAALGLAMIPLLAVPPPGTEPPPADQPSVAGAPSVVDRPLGGDQPSAGGQSSGSVSSAGGRQSRVDGGQGRKLLEIVGGGLVTLVGNPVLRAVTAATTLAFLGVGGLAVTAVLLAEHRGASASAGGQLVAAFALGALIGSLGAARWLSARIAEWVLLAGMVGFGCALLIIAAMPSLPWAIAACVLAGLVDGPVFAATLTVRQRESPPERLGQVNTTGGSLKIGSAALGAALTGALAAPLGAVGLLMAMAACQFVGAALGLLLLIRRG